MKRFEGVERGATGMHSGGMRTVCCGDHLGVGCVCPGGVYPGLGGVCPGGGRGLHRGMSAWGMSAYGVSAQWVSAWGVSTQEGGVYPSMQWGRHPLLWTEFLTHACENITFPQLPLWTVKIFKEVQRCVKRYKDGQRHAKGMKRYKDVEKSMKCTEMYKDLKRYKDVWRGAVGY